MATQRRPPKKIKTNNRLKKVKSIAECSYGAFCNTFDLHDLRPLFYLFLSARLSQVSLYHAILQSPWKCNCIEYVLGVKIVSVAEKGGLESCLVPKPTDRFPTIRLA